MSVLMTYMLLFYIGQEESKTRSQGQSITKATLIHQCENICSIDSGEQYWAILALLLPYQPEFWMEQISLNYFAKASSKEHRYQVL